MKSALLNSESNVNEIEYKRRRRHRTHRHRSFYREVENTELYGRSSRKSSRDSSRKSSRKSSRRRRKSGAVTEFYENKKIREEQIEESRQNAYIDPTYEPTEEPPEERYEQDPVLVAQANQLIKQLLNSIRVKSIDFTLKQPLN